MLMSSVCHWRTDRPYTRSYSRCQRPCGHRLRERRCLITRQRRTMGLGGHGKPWPWGPWVSLHVMRTRSGDLSHMRGPIFLRDRPFVSLTRNAPIERGLMRPLRGSSRPAGHGPADRGGPSTAFRPAGRQATVTLPAPVPAPQAHRGRGWARPSGSRRRGGRSFHRASYRGGQGF